MLAGVNVISCACGEETSASGGLSDRIPCVWGRVWRLRLLFDAVQETGTPAGITARPADTRTVGVALVAAP